MKPTVNLHNIFGGAPFRLNKCTALGSAGAGAAGGAAVGARITGGCCMVAIGPRTNGFSLYMKRTATKSPTLGL